MMTHPRSMLIDALRASGDARTAAGVERRARHARLAIPAHGFVLTEEKFHAIDRIAGEHFGLHALKRAMMRKLQAEIKPLEWRDPIEVAIGSVIAASDEAHYYFGLVTGLLLVPSSVFGSTQTVRLPAGLLDRPGRARRGVYCRRPRRLTCAIGGVKLLKPASASFARRRSVRHHRASALVPPAGHLGV
jgi:hypothetical protein